MFFARLNLYGVLSVSNRNYRALKAFLWALVMLFGLAFPDRVAKAQDSFRDQIRIYDRDDIHSIHKRLFSKDGRHELGLMTGGILNNDGFFLASVNYQYHFFEALSAEAQGAFGFQTEDDNRLIIGQLNAIFSPIYGKISWFTWAVLNFDLYAVGGAGLVQYSGLEDGTSFMGNAGLGLRFFATEWLSARVEFKDYIYNRKVAGSDSKISHNYSLMVGANIFFPFRQEL